jgi:hypothetical protein
MPLWKHLAAVSIATVVLFACTPPAPPPQPLPPPAPVSPPRRPLFDAVADQSEWLDLPAYVGGTLGQQNGLRSWWYRCQPARSGTLTASVESPQKILGFEIYNDLVVKPPKTARPLAVGGAATLPTVRMRVTRQVYYIRLFLRDDDTAIDYRLHLTFEPDPPPRPPPPPPPVPIPVPPPPPPLREQSRSDALLLARPIDGRVGAGNSYSARWYKIPVSAPSTLTVTLRATSGKPHIEILDPDNRTVRNFTGSNSVGIAVSPGTYFMKVSSPNGSGATYSLSAETLTEPESSTPIPLHPGESTRTAVGSGSGVTHRWYSFDLDAESCVRIHIDGRGDPVSVDLYDAHGNALAERQTITNGAVARVLHRGSYKVRISPAASQAEATIRLEVNKKSDALFTKPGTKCARSDIRMSSSSSS